MEDSCIYLFILTEERPVMMEENRRVGGDRNKAEFAFYLTITFRCRLDVDSPASCSLEA